MSDSSMPSSVGCHKATLSSIFLVLSISRREIHQYNPQYPYPPKPSINICPFPFPNRQGGLPLSKSSSSTQTPLNSTKVPPPTSHGKRTLRPSSSQTASSRCNPTLNYSLQRVNSLANTQIHIHNQVSTTQRLPPSHSRSNILLLSPTSSMPTLTASQKTPQQHP